MRLSLMDGDRFIPSVAVELVPALYYGRLIDFFYIYFFIP